ncbi:MAG: phosphodiesterase [Roseburia sp.]|nr:phosphodiesterase [Anaeroplasma bactoclasticum]MCM1196883.1 phosphodiesterase [Roseburia sp.]
MKYLIFSDLHGSAKSAEILCNIFIEQKCDQMICLGDVLYHGPRNDIPKFYSPKLVINLLNPFADKILCIQGNCDAEVDQMVLKFKLYKTKNIRLNGKQCHLEHGHHLLEKKKPTFDVVLFGHTHIPMLEKIEDVIYLNPGSVTLPKNNLNCSYMIWEKNTITLFDLQGHPLKSLSIV